MDGPVRPAPSKDEIFDAMAPFIVAMLSAESKAWREVRRGALSEWRRKLWLARVKQLRFRIVREQGPLQTKYSSLWKARDWPSPSATDGFRYYEWRKDVLKAHFWGMQRVHQRLLWRCIEALRPRSVLEVGCGNGLNLLALSTAFSGVRMSGIELSNGGIARAKEAQMSSQLLEPIASFCSWPCLAPHAFREIDFRQGDARNLPFRDQSFDLVFTLLALEQMEAIRDQALAEIARVSARWVAMIEPFPDFNRDPLRRACTKAKGYFSLRVAHLSGFGLRPVFVFDDMPQKVTLGAGFVLATKMQAGAVGQELYS
jgi:ubiquinone/menaquinone biosynthesis C-methylase UbiE